MFHNVVAGYSNMWDKCRIVDTTLVHATITRILLHKSVFEAAEQVTGAPWWWIAGVLYREADLDTKCYLGNGELLSKKTTLVPIGRGPFPDFVSGCEDALTIQEVDHFPLIHEAPSAWTIEFALYAAEELNGEGYTAHNENSPYVWAGTNLEQPGLFVSDHGFSATVSDKRLGIAAIVKGLETAGLVKLSRSTWRTDMATVAPAPTVITKPVLSIPGGPNIILEVEQGIGGILNILPTLAMFVPQLQITIPFIPAARELLNGLEQAAQSDDPIAEFGDELHKILDDVLVALGKKPA